MDWYSTEHRQIIHEAAARLIHDTEKYTPSLSTAMQTWLYHLAGSENPADYFMHPYAVPFLLLGWWGETHLRQDIDRQFQMDLAYSSMNAYYYVRLVDNFMDGDADMDKQLLPLAGVFHTQFQKVYQRYFLSDHPFWEFFYRIWFHQAEATMQDNTIEDITETAFTKTVAQKISGIKIPIGAVCYRYERLDVLPLWSRWVDLFGCWHMFWQDMFDWPKDLKHHNRTYFLAEAQRRKQPHESAAGWIMREGIDWGIGLLNAWMTELQAVANTLDFLPLQTYLEIRASALAAQRTKMDEGLKLMAKLATLEGLS